MNIIQWYLHNSPIQSGKGNIYNLFKSFAEKNNPLICTYDDNIKIEVDLHDKIQRHIFFYGCYRTEHKYKELMKSLIQPGDTVLDIGTHVGYYTLMFAKWVSKTGKVFAFEASGDTYKKLDRNIQLNRFESVVAVNAAASDKDEERDFYIFNDVDIGWNSLYPHCENAQKEKIRSIDVGRFVQNVCLPPPQLIKIDVEGHEPAVLKSLRSILEVSSDISPHVFVESNELTLSAARYTPDDIFRYMHDLSYRAYYINKKGEPEPRNAAFCDGLVYFKKI